MVTVIDATGVDNAVGRKLLVSPDVAPIGSLGTSELDRIAARDATAELEAARSGVRHYGLNGETTPEDLVGTPEVSVFIESWAPPPQMWIFGAVDFTAALAAGMKAVAIPHWLTERHDLSGADLTVLHAGLLTLDRLDTLLR